MTCTLRCPSDWQTPINQASQTALASKVGTVYQKHRMSATIHNMARTASTAYRQRCGARGEEQLGRENVLLAVKDPTGPPTAHSRCCTHHLPTASSGIGSKLSHCLSINAAKHFHPSGTLLMQGQAFRITQESRLSKKAHKCNNSGYEM